MKSLIIFFICIVYTSLAFANTHKIYCQEIPENYTESYHYIEIKEKQGKYTLFFNYYDDDDYGYSAPLYVNAVRVQSLYNNKVADYERPSDGLRLRIYGTRKLDNDFVMAKLRFEKRSIANMNFACKLIAE